MPPIPLVWGDLSGLCRPWSFCCRAGIEFLPAKSVIKFEAGGLGTLLIVSDLSVVIGKDVGGRWESTTYLSQRAVSNGQYNRNRIAPKTSELLLLTSSPLRLCTPTPHSSPPVERGSSRVASTASAFLPTPISNLSLPLALDTAGPRGQGVGGRRGEATW
ncbi:hypothetical protein BDP81DRAFT_12103 [Colletotrichum phormii]|uniref:Uncharacterized protein n=1 Tax=Colletotrichum phormii TaxID=359342 RepID=A0AAJ0EK12_9PEZI|nr:uncharacterized protein BDP81DRAFT_12103 [Colletotrichum phormii]KAK1655905.1 hypothetical protein BDP81DRAFT_12103 [Colletotrichum phormii]